MLFDLYLQADALYFQARENRVSYAIANHKVQNPDFNAHFGVRGKMGVGLPNDCMQLWIQYLHFHARTRESQRNAVFIPTWGHPFLNQNVTEVFNLWRLHLGLLDLGLSRSWVVSDCLELIPYAALRYAEIRQKLKIDYGTVETLSMKNKFWSGGPLMGVEARWAWTCWLHFFSRGAFSLVFGKTYVHQDDETSTTKVKFLNEFNQVRGIVEAALGLDFPLFSSMRIRIAWESYLFWGQNQLPRFVDPLMPGKFVANQGNLSLQGLSLGIIF